jgi:hypothetical protein
MASMGAAGGAVMAGVASMTITWVVCCAAPTWIVGLAILGVSVTTAFALQPIGGWLTLLGIGLLSTGALALTGWLSERELKAADAPPMPRQLAGMTAS